jgi:phosphoacetylglucosamine mutase
MDIPSWHKIYTDLPSKQLKVPVLNKSLVTCSEDETSVITPKALQDELNVLMSEVSLGRCFIRPSGTEDVVRVYAEGMTQDDADRLASGCVTAISKHLG